MEVRTNNLHSINFKGYGARPLKGVFMRYTTAVPRHFEKIAVQMEQIGRQHGFDVFIQGNNEILSRKMQTLPAATSPIRGGANYTWVQDNVTFLTDNIILHNNKIVTKFNTAVSKFFGAESKSVDNHIAGGNYFILDNNGEKELLLGRFDIGNISELTKDLGINSVNIISQADFHLDLFIRPLKDKVVLLADDKIWFDRVSSIIEKIELDKTLSADKKICKVCNKLKEIKALTNSMNIPIPDSQYKPLKQVEEELSDAGYKVVKVPGRIFDYINEDDGILPNHFLNYMNSIVHENPQGELVYITNKSNLNNYCGITKSVAEKIGFDFNSEFINSVKDYIKPENIYFVDSKFFLKEYQGGIHCLAAEIPKP